MANFPSFQLRAIINQFVGEELDSISTFIAKIDENFAVLSNPSLANVPKRDTAHRAKLRSGDVVIGNATVILSPAAVEEIIKISDDLDLNELEVAKYWLAATDPQTRSWLEKQLGMKAKSLASKSDVPLACRGLFLFDRYCLLESVLLLFRSFQQSKDESEIHATLLNVCCKLINNNLIRSLLDSIKALGEMQSVSALLSEHINQTRRMSAEIIFLAFCRIQTTPSELFALVTLIKALCSRIYSAESIASTLPTSTTLSQVDPAAAETLQCNSLESICTLMLACARCMNPIAELYSRDQSDDGQMLSGFNRSARRRRKVSALISNGIMDTEADLDDDYDYGDEGGVCIERKANYLNLVRPSDQESIISMKNLTDLIMQPWEVASIQGFVRLLLAIFREPMCDEEKDEDIVEMRFMIDGSLSYRAMSFVSYVLVPFLYGHNNASYSDTVQHVVAAAIFCLVKYDAFLYMCEYKSSSLMERSHVGSSSFFTSTHLTTTEADTDTPGEGTLGRTSGSCQASCKLDRDYGEDCIHAVCLVCKFDPMFAETFWTVSSQKSMEGDAVEVLDDKFQTPAPKMRGDDDDVIGASETDSSTFNPLRGFIDLVWEKIIDPIFLGPAIRLLAALSSGPFGSTALQAYEFVSARLYEGQRPMLCFFLQLLIGYRDDLVPASLSSKAPQKRLAEEDEYVLLSMLDLFKRLFSNENVRLRFVKDFATWKLDSSVSVELTTTAGKAELSKAMLAHRPFLCLLLVPSLSSQLKEQLLNVLSSLAQSPKIRDGMWDDLIECGWFQRELRVGGDIVSRDTAERRSGTWLARYGTLITSSVKDEFANIESRAGTFPALKGFLNLIGRLVHSQRVLSHPALPVYLEFIIDDVFMEFDGWAYSDLHRSDKWIIGCRCLQIILAIISQYPIEIVSKLREESDTANGYQERIDDFTNKLNFLNRDNFSLSDLAELDFFELNDMSYETLAISSHQVKQKTASNMSIANAKKPSESVGIIKTAGFGILFRLLSSSTTGFSNHLRKLLSIIDGDMKTGDSSQFGWEQAKQDRNLFNHNCIRYLGHHLESLHTLRKDVEGSLSALSSKYGSSLSSANFSRLSSISQQKGYHKALEAVENEFNAKSSRLSALIDNRIDRLASSIWWKEERVTLSLAIIVQLLEVKGPLFLKVAAQCNAFYQPKASELLVRVGVASSLIESVASPLIATTAKSIVRLPTFVSICAWVSFFPNLSIQVLSGRALISIVASISRSRMSGLLSLFDLSNDGSSIIRASFLNAIQLARSAQLVSEFDLYGRWNQNELACRNASSLVSMHGIFSSYAVLEVLTNVFITDVKRSNRADGLCNFVLFESTQKSDIGINLVVSILDSSMNSQKSSACIERLFELLYHLASSNNYSEKLLVSLTRVLGSPSMHAFELLVMKMNLLPLDEATRNSIGWFAKILSRYFFRNMGESRNCILSLLFSNPRHSLLQLFLNHIEGSCVSSEISAFPAEEITDEMIKKHAIVSPKRNEISLTLKESCCFFEDSSVDLAGMSYRIHTRIWSILVELGMEVDIIDDVRKKCVSGCLEWAKRHNDVIDCANSLNFLMDAFSLLLQSILSFQASNSQLSEFCGTEFSFLQVVVTVVMKPLLVVCFESTIGKNYIVHRSLQDATMKIVLIISYRLRQVVFDFCSPEAGSQKLEERAAALQFLQIIESSIAIILQSLGSDSEFYDVSTSSDFRSRCYLSLSHLTYCLLNNCVLPQASMSAECNEVAKRIVFFMIEKIDCQHLISLLSKDVDGRTGDGNCQLCLSALSVACITGQLLNHVSRQESDSFVRQDIESLASRIMSLKQMVKLLSKPRVEARDPASSASQKLVCEVGLSMLSCCQAHTEHSAAQFSNGDGISLIDCASRYEVVQEIPSILISTDPKAVIGRNSTFSLIIDVVKRFSDTSIGLRKIKVGNSGDRSASSLKVVAGWSAVDSCRIIRALTHEKGSQYKKWLNVNGAVSAMEDEGKNVGNGDDVISRICQEVISKSEVLSQALTVRPFFASSETDKIASTRSIAVVVNEMCCVCSTMSNVLSTCLSVSLADPSLFATGNVKSFMEHVLPKSYRHRVSSSSANLLLSMEDLGLWSILSLNRLFKVSSSLANYESMSQSTMQRHGSILCTRLLCLANNCSSFHLSVAQWQHKHVAFNLTNKKQRKIRQSEFDLEFFVHRVKKSVAMLDGCLQCYDALKAQQSICLNIDAHGNLITFCLEQLCVGLSIWLTPLMSFLGQERREARPVVDFQADLHAVINRLHKSVKENDAVSRIKDYLGNMLPQFRLKDL